MNPKPQRRVIPATQQAVLGGVPSQRLLSSDAYHFFLTASWRTFMLTVLALYVVSNCIFASIYLSLGHVIENAHPGSFTDAFFFSVQTMATIGYGKMTPIGTAANMLVALEALYGIVLSALMTGVVLARFTRPTAGVRFSKKAVIHNHDGVPTLKIRMANERERSHVVEASARLVLVRDEVSAEGQRYRRPEELELLRSGSPVFALSWTVMHPITRLSPLFREENEGGIAAMLQTMQENNWYLVVIFNGYHETFATDVHTRMTYHAKDIVLGGNFADVMYTGAKGELILDLRHFDEVNPL